VVSIVVVLYLTSVRLNFIGVVAATLAYILGRIAANLYLIKPILAIFRK